MPIMLIVLNVHTIVIVLTEPTMQTVLTADYVRCVTAADNRLTADNRIVMRYCHPMTAPSDCTWIYN